MKKAIVPIVIIALFIIAAFLVIRHKGKPHTQSENDIIDSIQQVRAKEYLDSAINSNEKANEAQQKMDSLKINPTGYELERKRLDSIIRADVKRKRSRTS